MAFLGLAFAGCETRIPDGFLGIRYESTSVANRLTTAISLSASSMAENNSAGDLVGIFQSTDPDSGDSFNYALVEGDGDTDNSSFSISGNELKLGVSANFEAKNSYSVRVRSTDAGGLSFEQAFTISVTNVNETPSALALSSSSLAENSAVGATVGTLSSTDPDSGDTFTYSLVSGAGDTDNASFSISGNELKLGVSANFEAKNSYSVRVRSTDAGSLSFEQAFTISVTNVNETPSALALSSSSLAENNAVGATVGTLSSTDPDSNESFTYALVAGDGDTDNSSFSVSGNELKLGVSSNFEAKSSYSVRVRSTDAGGLSFEQAFTISVTNVIETPTAVLIVNDSSAYSSLSSTPLISWVTQAQPVGISVARYEYSLGSSAGATDVLPWQSSGTLNQAQPTGLSLTQGTRYYANVRVVSTDGEISAVVSSDGWVADTQAPTVALATPSNRAQYSGSFTLTGSCSSDESSVVSLSYGNLSLSGPTEASCVDNAFSATLTTDRTVSLGQVTVTQSDLASNVASKSLNIAGMTEYIQLPSNRNEFTSIASNTVNDVSVVGSGPTAQVFVSTTGGLSISSDGGATFTTRTTANGLGSNQVNGVFVVGSGSTAQVFAGTTGGLSISTDGGATFTNRTTAHGLGNNQVNGVFVVGSGSTAQVFVAVGTIGLGGLSISSDGGATFTNRTTAHGLGGNEVKGVFVVGSGPTAQVFAGTTGGLSISTDGGATFTNRTTAHGLGNNQVNGVFVVGSGPTAQVFAAAWAMGLGGLSISTDGGATFTNKTTVNGLGSNQVNGVSVVGSGSTAQVFAATSGGLSISTDGGATFTNKTTANALAGNSISGVSAVGSGPTAQVFVAMVGGGGGLSISTDGGATFTNRTTANGLGGNQVNGVSVVGSGPSAQVFVAVGVNFMFGGGGGLSISTDGGATFTNKTTAHGLGSNQVNGVSAVGSGSAAQVFVSTTGGLSISSDGGATFTNKTTAHGLGSNQVNGVSAVGSGPTAQVFAATSGGLSISTDGGATFTNKSTANSLGSNTVNRVFVVGSGSTAQVFAATSSGLSISTDGGSTFTTKTTAHGLGSNTVNDVFVVGSGSAAQVFAATSGGLSISTDGGATFTTRTTAHGLGSINMRSVSVVGSGSTAQVFVGTSGAGLFTRMP